MSSSSYWATVAHNQQGAPAQTSLSLLHPSSDWGTPRCPPPPHSCMCLEHLPREVIRRHPYQMLEPLQLTPFNAKKQLLYSEFLTDDWTSHLLPKGDASHPPGKPISAAHICSLIFLVMAHRRGKEQGLSPRWRAWPFNSALFLLQWCSKASAKLLPLHQFSGQSLPTRDRDTWTPSLEVRTHSLFGVISPWVSCCGLWSQI